MYTGKTQTVKQNGKFRWKASKNYHLQNFLFIEKNFERFNKTKKDPKDKIEICKYDNMFTY